MTFVLSYWFDNAAPYSPPPQTPILTPVNQSTIDTILRSFLLQILPAGTPVIKGQANRVAEPQAPDFVIFTCMRRQRLATNVDEFADATFIGSIAGTSLTISDQLTGKIEIGAPVFGPGVAVGQTIVAQTGPGAYTVSISQGIADVEMASGQTIVVQETEIVYQLDVHGPNSADNAQRISTLFRDEYAVDIFAALNEDVSPLYADDPRQMPFLNAEQQIETRWIIEAHVQANQTVLIPQQYADSLEVNLVNVEANYLP